MTSAGRPPALLTLRVDDERLELPTDIDPGTTLDVLLNGRHVWSLVADRDATRTEDGYVASWPEALHSYLVGRAEVVLRDHVDGSILARTRHVFGDDETVEVMVARADGRDLVLDKYGRLIRPLSTEDGALIDELMDAVVQLLQDLAEGAGVPAFIAYGTLLGAIRNGELIGHDNDIDIAYVSQHPYPVDVVREGFRVEQVLRDRGWVVRRGSGTRMNVRMRLSDGTMRFVDIFTAHWVDGIVYMPSDTGFELGRDAFLPLRPVELLGRKVPAPADSETLLAATYGPGWRVPDPSFKYETPRWLSRRIGGWFGGLKSHRNHWDAFYKGHTGKVPNEPTPFAEWVAQNYPSDRPLFDVGAGNARDARWFAQETGRPVTAVDYSVGVLTRTARRVRADDPELPLTLQALNLYDRREVLALGTRLSRAESPVDLYARFAMHALDYYGRENLLRLANLSLRRGGLLFLEFRTPRDRDRPHVFGQQTRRYLRPMTVARQIRAAGGEVVHQSEGTGLAPFRSEDPHVCRIVARWDRRGPAS